MARGEIPVGALSEFLLVGGATLVLFPLAWLGQRVLGLDASEYAVGFLTFHAAHVINDPHFAVTYLLFYRNVKRRALGGEFQGAQRARYWVAGALVPAALLLWAGGALAAGSARGLGWLIQLMFFLVGWHYSKQAFGILMVLSARRGVRLEEGERRAFLAHSFAGWAYAWASPADPGREVEEKGVVYTSLAHGSGLELGTKIVFYLSAAVLLGVLLRRLRRGAPLPPAAALAGYLVGVWLWTVYTSLDPLMVYLIPALHSIQYLYFVGLLRGNEARLAEGPPSFGRPAKEQLGLLALGAGALGFLLFHGAPALLDGWRAARTPRVTLLTGDLGPTPYLAAILAVVNIHHYAMDSVIWRRENPETRFLLERGGGL